MKKLLLIIVLGCLAFTLKAQNGNENGISKSEYDFHQIVDTMSVNDMNIHMAELSNSIRNYASLNLTGLVLTISGTALMVGGTYFDSAIPAILGSFLVITGGICEIVSYFNLLPKKLIIKPNGLILKID